MFKDWRVKTVFMFAFIPFFAILVARLVQWQVLSHAKFEALAEQQRTIDVEVSSPRGSIFSADGSVLAYNEPVWGVYLNVKDFREGNEERSKYEITRLLSPILEMEEKDLDGRINLELDYVPLKHKVSEDVITRLKELEIESLRFEDEERRVYPEGMLASHVIGFVGKNDNGKEEGKYGVEGYFDGDLSGKEGFVSAELDTFGRQIITGDLESIRARRGRDITLTIDRGLQRIVENGIKKGVEEYESKSGTVIVMDPKTGEILAMANYPNYDPNKYWEVEDSAILSNLAVSHTYEFGSVGKIFTASGVVNEGEADMNTTIEAHSGCIQILDKEVCNWNRQAHGDESLTEVLQHSCNIGTYYFANKLGNQKLYTYLHKFGIGRLTNITLQEDTTSFLKDWEDWNDLDRAASSFGQAISATPLQIISGFSAVANNGKRMQPMIVTKLEDDERVVEIEPKVIDEPITKDTADMVTEMMIKVVDEGSFQWFVRDIQNYKIAGKTGSAQVPYEDRPGYDASRVNVTFVGFDATPERKFVMLVRLQEPKKGEFASEIAVPVWVDIFKDLSVYMRIVPEN